MNLFLLWDRLRAVLPHRFMAMRGRVGCGLCGVAATVHRRGVRCALGLHDDGTDVLGGYSPTCLRCGRPV